MALDKKQIKAIFLYEFETSGKAAFFESQSFAEPSQFKWSQIVPTINRKWQFHQPTLFYRPRNVSLFVEPARVPRANRVSRGTQSAAWTRSIRWPAWTFREKSSSHDSVRWTRVGSSWPGIANGWPTDVTLCDVELSLGSSEHRRRNAAKQTGYNGEPSFPGDTKGNQRLRSTIVI